MTKYNLTHALNKLKKIDNIRATTLASNHKTDPEKKLQCKPTRVYHHIWPSL